MLQKKKSINIKQATVNVGKIVDMQQTTASRQSWSKVRQTLPTRLRIETTLDLITALKRVIRAMTFFPFVFIEKNNLVMLFRS